MEVKSKVLALKYRPVVFEDIIGQKIVSDTIFNSIKINKTPNAYKAISSFDISKEKFSESASKRAFANLARAFQKDRLKLSHQYSFFLHLLQIQLFLHPPLC